MYPPQQPQVIVAPAGGGTVLVLRRSPPASVRQALQCRILASMVFLGVAISLALTLSFRSSSSTSDVQPYYFAIPAALLLFLLVSLALRITASRAAARQAAMQAAAGGPAPYGAGTSWVPQAMPVGQPFTPPPPPGWGAPPLPPQSYQQPTPYPVQAGAPAPFDGAASTLCAVCMANPRTTALGCGHVFCDGCAHQLASCALCRVPVATRIRLYG